MTLKRLQNDFDGLFDKIEQAVVLHSKEVALVFVGKVTAYSRVDTSKLISNYQVSVGSREGSVLDAFIEGSRGSTGEASRSVAIFEAEESLSAKTQVGQDIYIVNNVDYLLEDVDIGRTFETSVIQVEASKRSFANAKL